MTIRPPTPTHEPVLSYGPGTPERAELLSTLAAHQPEELPLWIGGERVQTDARLPCYAPHDHARKLAEASLAGEAEVARALSAASEARADWAARSQAERSRVFLRAAELLAGPFRQRLNAATLLNQSKTIQQAEIDAACELCDFFRFNVSFADVLTESQPHSPPGVWNRLEARPLDGFVYAITPFNFTSIAANLPAAPALMGNTVLWKPSPSAMLSAQRVMELFTLAGLPPGVINLINGDAAAISRQVLAHRDFAGLHYTGSTTVFRSLWGQIAAELPRYRSYPRLVGETGGKDFILAHPSADPEALAAAIVLGGFEYQGQKCSAASRVYVPRSLWARTRERALEILQGITLGDPADLRHFMGAVIHEGAFERLSGAIARGLSDPRVTLIAGGGCHREVGWFIEPTLLKVEDPNHALMTEELFGPVVSVLVYDDDRFEQVLRWVDESDYALTGAVFARDAEALAQMDRALRFAAGNYYVNDKPTGAVVGQQPFGGGRLSGTNDKAGSPHNLMRWVSLRTIKETFVPRTSWRYPHQD